VQAKSGAPAAQTALLAGLAAQSRAGAAIRIVYYRRSTDPRDIRTT